MHKIILVGLLMLLFFIFTGADSLPIIELKRGMNEVSIKILNESNLDFESVYVGVKNEDLPKGLSIYKDSQSINVSAKSKNESENSLLLRVEVNEHAEQGVYKIPFTLKDKANHAWSYTFFAKVEIQKPEKYDLLQNFPNPFNAQTQIKYLLANKHEQETRIVIFNLLGRQIRTLVNKTQPAGTYNVIWDGKDEEGKEVASGIYCYKVISGSFVKTRKMLYLK